jgi:replicative DNA helicase
MGFDILTSGMQRGDLLILAARPSMGKTALALNIALNAWKHNHAVAIFSLEMAAEQLALRFLSAESRIPHQKIRNALVSSDEWLTLTNTAAHLAEAKIFVDDSPSLTIMELRAKARKLKAQENIGLVVIDYLQLIGSQQRHENRTQEISAISRALKALAKELNVPVLALSQLSRNLESRMDKRPMLSDLRESGAIEQDGDVIFFIYRDVIYNPDTEYPNMAEIIISKQRNGPVGSFHTQYAGEILRFEDIEGG